MSKESKGAQNPPDSASTGQTPAGEGRMKLAFEMKTVRLALGDISPLHQIKDLHKGTFRYKKIISSLKIVGSVEPMVVYPQKDAPGKYLLKNGHLRLAAMKELGFTTALCIVATDDECYTYNARINRLPPIQEHKMIVKAVNDGVIPERLAEALDMPVHVIMAAMRLLNGIDERAAELLKDKNISQPAIRMLRKVKPERQVEIAEMMVAANNFNTGYTEALVLGTAPDLLLHPGIKKLKKGMSADDVARMQHEMESLERDLKTASDNYMENMFTLQTAQTYIKNLLKNTKVAGYLTKHHTEIQTVLAEVAAAETV